jgi:hypothetical protein
MSDDAGAWVTVLGLTPERADRFEQLADEPEEKPSDILRLMVARVIESDRELGGGRTGLKKWLSTREIVDRLVEGGLGGLSLEARKAA